MILVISCIAFIAAIALYFINEARIANHNADWWEANCRGMGYYVEELLDENGELRALLKKHAPHALQKRVGGKFSK